MTLLVWEQYIETVAFVNIAKLNFLNGKEEQPIEIVGKDAVQLDISHEKYKDAAHF